MPKNYEWIHFDLLESFMADSFQKIGLPDDDAKICAKVLIEADKRGFDSHGINRFKSIYLDRIRSGQVNPVTQFEIVKEGPTTAVVDGNNGMGPVIAKRSMSIAIQKAKHFGMGMVAVRNSNHYGIAGYYAQMAVENGMIGITGTNARPSIAPTFSIENMLGTNPLVFGLPTDESFPFILDCATSVAQRGKIEVFARLGKPIPEGWVIGKDGQYRTDSEQILVDLLNGSAALVPLGGTSEETGGHKGYGYATVVEILSAALQGGTFLKGLMGINQYGKTVPYRLGHFFIAIDISAFIGLDEFKKITGDIMRGLRQSQKMAGADRIYTAGEKEYLVWMKRKDKGVKLDKELVTQLLQIRDDFGLSQYRFPFEPDEASSLFTK